MYLKPLGIFAEDDGSAAGRAKIIYARLRQLFETQPGWEVAQSCLVRLAQCAEEETVMGGTLLEACLTTSSTKSETASSLLQVMQYIRGAEARLITESLFFEQDGVYTLLSIEECTSAMALWLHPKTGQYDPKIMSKIFPGYQLRTGSHEALALVNLNMSAGARAT